MSHLDFHSTLAHFSPTFDEAKNPFILNQMETNSNSFDKCKYNDLFAFDLWAK